MAGQLLAFRLLRQTFLLHHPQALQFHGPEMRALEAEDLHRGDLLLTLVGSHFGLLCRLKSADQGLFLDRHCSLHSPKILSSLQTRIPIAMRVPNFSAGSSLVDSPEIKHLPPFSRSQSA